MDSFGKRLNQLLVATYRDIMKVEQAMLNSGNVPLSISEIHLLEAVSKEDGRPKTVSELAFDLGITLSSVTIAVGKLGKKGYLTKEKSENDGRSVHISLTAKGVKIDRLHRYFHWKMISAVTAGISEEEKRVLLTGIEKLDDFFKKKVSQLED